MDWYPQIPVHACSKSVSYTVDGEISDKWNLRCTLCCWIHCSANAYCLSLILNTKNCTETMSCGDELIFNIDASKYILNDASIHSFSQNFYRLMMEYFNLHCCTTFDPLL